MLLIRVDPDAPPWTDEELQRLEDIINDGRHRLIEIGPSLLNVMSLGAIARRIERAFADDLAKPTEETLADRMAIGAAARENLESDDPKRWANSQAAARVVWLEGLLVRALSGDPSDAMHTGAKD
jgi:hypothetical protein